ncbi:MAG: hypothetical protein RID15_18305 [Marinovum algicola]|uniref:Uncharacterized protein n=1 Tax=Marinovum algicola TaxID=42444 RepID=A0A975WE35_9RHOB|nr:hypothetical protein [Marinovum algicola]SEK05598.1 hypothetical protein SAMN04487940_1222 [Marinovum algicola]SLN72142.1 hypothetical protein MAA5396_04017 [Marinovum algicola]
MTDRPSGGGNDRDIGPHLAISAIGHPKRQCRAIPFLTIIQCLATRDLEAYCGSVYLGAVTPTEPGSSDEVAEIYTVALIELLEVLGRMSNHERMLVVEGISRQLDISSAPSRPGLLAAGSSEIAWRDDAFTG